MRGLRSDGMLTSHSKGQIESGHIEGIYHECLSTELDILVKKKIWVFNIQARAPTEAVIPKYVQPKTILSLDVPADLKQFVV